MGERDEPHPATAVSDRLAGDPSRHAAHDVSNGGWRPPDGLSVAGFPALAARDCLVKSRYRAQFLRPTPFCTCTAHQSLNALEARQIAHDPFVHAPPAISSMQPDILVLDSLVAMQRLADCVRRGYHWHTSGVVPAARTSALLVKFGALYFVNRHRNTRRRQQRRGVAAAVLLLYQPVWPGNAAPASTGEASGGLIAWTLLLTNGESAARHLEALQLATNAQTPIRVGQYELVRKSRAGSSRPAWTFRMTPVCYETFRSRAIRSARNDPREPAESLLKDLYRQPGFAGVRSQVGRIVGLFRREFRRRHPRGATAPRLPKLWYVQRLPNSGVWLSELVPRSSTPSDRSLGQSQAHSVHPRRRTGAPRRT